MAQFAVSQFAERLRIVVGDEPVNRFAKRAGVSEGSLRQHLNGSMPGIDKAAAYAQAGDVRLDWLIANSGSMRDERQAAPSGTVLPSDFRMIPRLDVQAAAGSGSLVESEETAEMLAFRGDWLRRRGINPLTAHVLTARGDSMEPTIRDGDILLIDTSIDRVVDNAIYVVNYAGRTLVKRVQLRLDGSVLLRSDNKDIFDDEEVPPDEVVALNVAGRVMWYGRSI